MATRVRRRQNTPQTFRSGPYKGTRTTVDVGDEPPDLLYDALNTYFPDTEGLSGVYQRPGMELLNNGDPLVVSASPFKGQGGFSHTALDGTSYNFIVFAGQLFRIDGTLQIITDVTPIGVAIDSALTTRVYGTSFLDQLVITDGVHRPWVASNLGNTPITGTYIDYDGAAVDWSVFGPMKAYAGSLFGILNEVDGVAARASVTYSIFGDATVGYQQADYDFTMTLIQSVNPTESPNLYALAGTDVGLYYFRGSSIGVLSGIPGPDLRGQITSDLISKNVGTLTPQSIVQYGLTIYFTDQVGRPYRLVPGQDPEAIWLQLRTIVESATIGFPIVTQRVTTATFEPTLNLWAVAPWSETASQGASPVEGYLFDARTGTYFSRLSVAGGIQIDCLCTLLDSNGRGILTILGSAEPPSGSTQAASGYVWTMNALTAQGDFLLTEGGDFLTTEGAVNLTTEGTDANWDDGGEGMEVAVTTNRNGYDADAIITVDRVTALVGTTDPVAVSIQTAAVTETAQGTPTPSTVQDGVAKLTVGASGMSGRGASVTLSPTTTATQWSVQQIEVVGVLSLATPEDV